MAEWNSILEELKSAEMPHDLIRKKYLKKLSEMTDRNVIAYYSCFLSKEGYAGIDINDMDMNGFMNVVRNLDCRKGLDLILHTPGGSPAAAEAIVDYLRNKFNSNIRVIVPHMAMSAGTMIACSATEIIMGKHSSLGPIDPQINGIPAYSIKGEFDAAKEDLAKSAENAMYWNMIMQKYPPTFLSFALDAIELSNELISKWLGTSMFNKDKDKELIKRITDALNEHDNSKIHARHFDINKCKEIGLKIVGLEEDDNLQDIVLSIHYAFMETMSISNTIKIIENNLGKSWISLASTD